MRLKEEMNNEEAEDDTGEDRLQLNMIGGARADPIQVPLVLNYKKHDMEGQQSPLFQTRPVESFFLRLDSGSHPFS